MISRQPPFQENIGETRRLINSGVVYGCPAGRKREEEWKLFEIV